MKCGGHSFELALFTPLGESRKLKIVQCSSCGVPLGIFDPTTEIRIEALQNRVTAIDDGLKQIAKAL
jgi:hypothetical protein